MSPVATMTMDDADKSILSAADDLFYSRGIAAVSMSDVRDRSGVSMRRLYTLYPSKGALVAGWLAQRHQVWMTWFTTAVDRHIAQGTDALLAPFDAIGEWVATSVFRGCGFINSIAEVGEIDDTHRLIIAGHKRDVLRHIAELAQRSDHPVPEWLPASLAVLLDGAIVQCAIFGNDEPLTAARSAALQLLGTIPT